MDVGRAVTNLPPNWNYAVTSDGRVFFIDENRQLTTWLHPTTGNPVQTGFIRDQGLSHGWELDISEAGKFVFIDHVNRTTTYESPVQFDVPFGDPSNAISDDAKLERSDFHRTNSKKKRGRVKSIERAPMAKRDPNAPVKLKGWLYKQDGSLLKPWKKRWCVLSNYCLYCYEGEDEQNLVTSVILPGFVITESSRDVNARRYSFKVEHEKIKPTCFATESEGDRTTWIEELRLAATLQTDDATNLKRPLDTDESNLRRFPNQNLLNEPLYRVNDQQPVGNGGGADTNYYPDYGYEAVPRRPLSQTNAVRSPGQAPHQTQDYTDGYYASVQHPQSRFSPPRDIDQTRHNSAEFPNGVIMRQPQFSGRTENTYPHGGQPNDGNHSGYPGVNPQSAVMGDPNDLYAKVVRTRPAHQPSTVVKSQLIEMVAESRDVRQQPHPMPAGHPDGRRSPRPYGGDYVASDYSYQSNADPTDVRFRQDGVPVSRDHNFNVSKLSDSQYHPSAKGSYRDVSGIHHQRPDVNTSFRSSDNFGGRQAEPRVISRGERHLDGTPMFGDNVKKMPPQGGSQSVSPRSRPNQLPVSVVMRDRYIDELAETKTPHTRQDLLQAKELSHRRLGEPSFFKYPDGDPQRQSHHQHSDVSRGGQQLRDSWSELRSQNSFITNGTDRRPYDAGSSRLTQGRDRARRDENQSNRLNDRNLIRNPSSLQESFDTRTGERPSPRNDSRLNAQPPNRIVPNGHVLTDNSRNASRQHSYADLRPVHGQRSGMVNRESRSAAELRSLDRSMGSSLYPPPTQNHVADSNYRSRGDEVSGQRGFAAIKEDPDMSDADLMNTRTLDQLRKHLSGHVRLRLSISAQDLGGKSHEELVLLLIQLKRSQTKLEKMRVWLRDKLNARRPDERAYQHDSSIGHADPTLQQKHEYFMELEKEAGELEKQVETTQPLINLLDNIVTMGSLYGGDNLLYDSQYKKRQLPPGQSVNTKNMLDFSRRHQEEQLALKQKQSMRKLTEDEVNLEERLQQLYQLDRLVQERSFNVTSLQEDQSVLEKSLEESKRSEEYERDPYARERLSQRRQVLEQELSRVRQQLADASRLLEEASTENAKVEQEVIVLRNKVYGITKSTSTPPAAGAGSSQAIIQMEQELSQVRSMMQGLSTQGTSLSETMRNLKPQAPPIKGTYMETDIDRRLTRDIAVREPLRGNQNSVYRHRPAPDSSNRDFRRPQDVQYRGQRPPQTDSKMDMIGGRRPAYKPNDSQHMFGPLAQTESPLRRNHRLAQSMYIPRRSGSDEDLRQRERNEVGNSFRAANDYDHRRNPAIRGSQKLAMTEPNHDEIGTPELRRAKSMPRVGQEPNYVRAAQPFSSPYKEEQRHSDASSSAVQRLFSSYNGSDANRSMRKPDQMYSPHKNPHYVSTAAGGLISPGAGNQTRYDRLDYDPPGERAQFSRTRNMTISSSHPAAVEVQRNALQHSRPQNSFPVKTRSVDDLIRADQTKTIEFDDFTIDRELLHPEQVHIPERYDPDFSDDDDELLTDEERRLRWEKREKYKKMLAAHSLQEFPAAELSSLDGPLHVQVGDVIRQREELLDMQQRLAQEVTQKSKDAAWRRRSNPNLPEAFASGSADRYQDRSGTELIGFVPLVR